MAGMEAPPAVGFALLTLGGALAALNFYLSFVRHPLHFLLGGTRDGIRNVSGFPVFGSLMLWIAAPLLWNYPTAAFAALTASLFDTAGLHWFLATCCFYRSK